MDKDLLAHTHKDDNKNTSSKIRKLKLRNLKARIQKKVELKPKPHTLKESPNKIDEEVASESTKIQKRHSSLKKILEGSIFKCTHAKTEKGKTFVTLQPLVYNDEEGRFKLMGVIVNGRNKVRKKKQQKVNRTDEYILPLSDAVKTNEFHEISKSGKVVTNKGTKEKLFTEPKSKMPGGITKRSEQIIKVMSTGLKKKSEPIIKAIDNKTIGQGKIENR